MQFSQKYIDVLNNKIYGKYFKIIDDFIVNNDLLVDNTQIKDNRYQYIIYCNNALKSSNELANLLAMETPYVEMLTNIPYKKFTLMVDTKYICSLYTLGYFKKQPIAKMLKLKTFIPPEWEYLIKVDYNYYQIM